MFLKSHCRAPCFIPNTKWPRRPEESVKHIRNYSKVTLHLLLIPPVIGSRWIWSFRLFFRSEGPTEGDRGTGGTGGKLLVNRGLDARCWQEAAADVRELQSSFRQRNMQEVSE
ncbi:hypothetical protein PBY51_004573 [Eleginops maclovinus]|uniref:Uncharacterized protein n=1 Tax=Eleginops maclovinus TaxID=56733 RepID=A0AAN7XX44_ELEMC|nr:hypothetical protein PBY51_004573 [Eleginops maclovinus]